MTNNLIKDFFIDVSNLKTLRINKDNNIRLFIGNSEAWLKDIDFIKESLDVSEQKRALKFLKKEDRDTYILAHYCLRKELAQVLNIPQAEVSIRVEKGQKPFLQNNSLDFNISHSKQFSAIVVADSVNLKLGVDIEVATKQADIDGIIKEYMHNDEIAYIKNKKGLKEFSNERFLEIWTRKEAFLKMLGIGITSYLPSINMVAGKRFISVEMPENYNISISRAYIYTISTKEYILSCSFSEPRTPILSYC